MENGQHVLVVDGMSETEAVLKAVLEPRGCRVDRIRSHQAADWNENASPNVVVWHDDNAGETADSSFENVPRVVIGSVELCERHPIGDPRVPDDSMCLSHPFNYAELIHAIERLLADPDDTPPA